MTEALRHFEEVYRVDADPWRYGERGAELHRHESIAEVVSRIPHGRTLEVGCSAGTLTARLSRLPDHLVALDLMALAVARARDVVAGVEGLRRAPTFLVGSVASLPFPTGSFDLIVAADGPLEWRLGKEGRLEVYRQFQAALSRGGHVLITEYMRPEEFPEFVAEVETSPLRIVEVRFLHDRAWYALERLLRRVLPNAVSRRILGKVGPARVLDRFGALFGARAARHILILAARE